MNDTDRFQTWQRDTLAGHDDGVEMLSAGPFRALLSAGDGATTGWATLIDGAPTEAETTKSPGVVAGGFVRASRHARWGAPVPGVGRRGAGRAGGISSHPVGRWR